jgi:hypothetical protein
MTTPRLRTISEKGPAREKGDGLRWFVASTEEVASDRGIILASGWRFNRFAKNPVLLWAHGRSSDTPPLGTIEKWEIDPETKQMLVGARFAPADVHPFAGMISRLCDLGIVRAVSVSWDTISERPPLPEEAARGARWVSVEQELVEVSIVPVGADPGAISVERCRSLTRDDARLIRSRLHGIEFWDALADSIERALAAPPAEPVPAPAPPAPEAGNATADSGRTEPPPAARAEGAPGGDPLATLVASARSGKRDAHEIASTLRSYALALAALADEIALPMDPQDETPTSPPSEHAHDSTKAAPVVEVSIPPAPPVAPPARGDAEEDASYMISLLDAAREFAGGEPATA